MIYNCFNALGGTKMIEVRNIPVSDIPQLLEIYQQGLDWGYATFNNVCPSAEKWDESHHAFCRIAAYQGDVMVGWAALTPVSARDCYRGVAEVSLYIREGYRGKGIGTLLISEMTKQSEAAGIWTLYASITSSNTASIKTFLKNGWRIVGTRERIAQNKFCEWLDTTIMERRNKIVGAD
jgi:phosphinothricin acetyltransferase